MSRLLPFRSEPELEDREPALVELDDDRAEEVFDALGSATARSILTAVHADPRPASELASEVDTSIQNVQYHLTKLAAAGLVETVDTWYGENGAEMDVYAPTDDGLVIVAGEDTTGTLRRLLERLVGATTPLVVGALALWWWAGDRGSSPPAPGGTNMTAPVGGSEAGVTLDPLAAVALFCCGGALALAGYGLVRAWQQ